MADQLKTERVEIRVTKDFLALVDAARGDVSRTRWIERALEKALNPPPPPPTEMLDEAHLKKMGRARLLPLDPAAPSVDEAMEMARVGAASEVWYVCRHGDHRAQSPKARCPRHGGALVPE